jgi:anti-anti-sigma factor
MENDQAASPRTHVVISSSGETIVVRVRGEVDTATVEVLRCALEVVEGARELVVDLSAAPFVDIAGIRALATCARRRGTLGRDVLLLAPPPSAQRILDLLPVCSELRWRPREGCASASAGCEPLRT